MRAPDESLESTPIPLPTTRTRLTTAPLALTMRIAGPPAPITAKSEIRAPEPPSTSTPSGHPLALIVVFRMPAPLRLTPGGSLIGPL